MQLFSPKTRKTIRKEFKRLFIKHGSEIVVGLLTGLLTNYMAGESGKSDKRKKKHKHKE
jgi:hypothetical protein